MCQELVFFPVLAKESEQSKSLSHVVDSVLAAFGCIWYLLRAFHIVRRGTDPPTPNPGSLSNLCEQGQLQYIIKHSFNFVLAFWNWKLGPVPLPCP